MKIGRFRLSIDSEDVSKPFLEHLEDLRDTLLRSTAALAAGFVVAVPLVPTILRWLKKPLFLVFPNPKDVEQFLWNWDVAGGFTLAMRIAIWSGIILSAPFILFFIAQFVFPGLTAKEKEVIRRSSGAAAGLFAAGVFLAYRFCLPVALRAMWAVNQWLGVRAQWTISSYITFALQFMLAFGLVFEMPIVLVILGRIGLIDAALLRTYRRHVYVALFILAAVLTPPDIFSQLLMGVPLILLYELCILFIAAAARPAKAGDVSDSPPSATM